MPLYEIPNGIGYTPSAEERTYQPPAPPPQFTPPPVTAGAARVEGTTLEQAHASLLHAHKEFQKHLDATNEHRNHYTDDGFKAQIDLFKATAAAKSVDQAEQQVVARRDQAQAQMDKV